MYGDEDRIPWPIAWSGVWVGALAALAAGLIVGLAGVALGAHVALPGHRIVRWRDFGIGALVFSVLGAFFSFVIGGWASARVAGARRAETATLHGVIAWLVATPLLLGLIAIGAGSPLGGWYRGLTGTPFWVTAPPTPADADAAAATRNAALGAVTALLLGLVGSVVGGWMASGERMTLRVSRTIRAAARRAA